MIKLLELSLLLPDANSINLSAELPRFAGVFGADDLDTDLEIFGDGDGVAVRGSLRLFFALTSLCEE